jgi:hypothetical protein
VRGLQTNRSNVMQPTTTTSRGVGVGHYIAPRRLDYKRHTRQWLLRRCIRQTQPQPPSLPLMRGEDEQIDDELGAASNAEVDDQEVPSSDDDIADLMIGSQEDTVFHVHFDELQQLAVLRITKCFCNGQFVKWVCCYCWCWCGCCCCCCCWCCC